MPTRQAKPKVSIGLVVYNGSKSISAAIESFLDQTFRDFELIISDNASSDETESICRKFASLDDRICYVRHPDNIGAAANFQYVFSSGLKNADSLNSKFEFSSSCRRRSKLYSFSCFELGP